MKVVAFNGSPRKNGNSFVAISTVLAELEKKGIETEIIDVGAKSISGCIACNACGKNRDEKCAIDDEVNSWIQKMKDADGILLASPTHYANIAGNMKSFLDRAFYVSSANGNLFRHKVGASVVAVRRTGGVAVYDALNRYISYSEMFMPSSNYWNVTHGNRRGETDQDEEGMQILEILGKNMAYLLEVLNNSKIEAPKSEIKKYMNFIR